MNELEFKFWKYFKRSFVDETNDLIIESNNGIINLRGKVAVSLKTLLGKSQKLPFTFGKTDGSFFVENSGLSTLEGCPRHVGKSFNCSSNNLVSLKGGPFICNESFACMNNKLKDLVGAPKVAKLAFNCKENYIQSLKGCPNKTDIFICDTNNLKSLEHGPQIVTDMYRCSNNPLLTSLLGAPKTTADFKCTNNFQLQSLDHLPIVTIYLSLSISSTLPLLRLVKQNCSITIVHFSEVLPITDIIKKHIGQSNKKAATLALQKELIDNGFAGNAGW